MKFNKQLVFQVELATLSENSPFFARITLFSGLPKKNPHITASVCHPLYPTGPGQVWTEATPPQGETELQNHAVKRHPWVLEVMRGVSGDVFSIKITIFLWVSTLRGSRSLVEDDGLPANTPPQENYHLVVPNIAGWKISIWIFLEIHRLKWWISQPAMLDYRSLRAWNAGMLLQKC